MLVWHHLLGGEADTGSLCIIPGTWISDNFNVLLHVAGRHTAQRFAFDCGK